ncbi:MAG: AmmeMemoRadiSam system radical SAM enzyme [Spirochaetota bacterium]|nr:AmmeMemoRadiSam system radical SAM enzyme [Spirochaetota bacterium]
MSGTIEAQYYNVIDRSRVKCLLCPHNCVIQNGKTGICGVRKNVDSRLITTIYGELTAQAIDPIEKKPLYHFYPGSDILSIGTKGCNFSCFFCQNWHISQNLNVNTYYSNPEDIVADAKNNNSLGIAYTYSEPFIWFEFVMDCMISANKNGIKNVFVTNGYINSEPLKEILEYADAMNIDLKSFRESTYKKIMNGRLSSVLDTVQSVYKRSHLEITTLVVTGMNDDIEEMREIVDWISSIDRRIPWHISRYYPSYKYNAPSTDIDFMFRLYDEAVKKLDFVYCGNISPSHGRSDTICPSCRDIVISRSGYSVKVQGLEAGKCANCGYHLKIIH